MNTIRQFAIILIFGIFISIQSQAQVHVGVYHSGSINQVGIGTDNEKKYFGELRLLATDIIDFPFGVEGLFHRNFRRGDWVNLHAGIMLGILENGSNAKVGLPLGLTFKPIAAHRNFAILMEATPFIYPDTGYFAIRSNIGLRYSFRKE
jgi:hypothetical protein